MPETSCVKETSVHIENKRIKQLCKHKISDFGMAFWVRKLFGTFEKWAPDLEIALLGACQTDGSLCG